MKRVLHASKIVVLYAFFVFLKSTQCSTLYEDLDVVDYCNNQESMCANSGLQEHVVCQYYGKTGPSCSNFQEVHLDINDGMAILEQVNHMRSQAANGLAVGKDQQPLPQAYGMMEMSWDIELASMARMMTKQCLNTHMHGCAATKNFTDPIMGFIYGSLTSDVHHFDHILETTLALWGTSSNLTTADQIFHSPDLKGEDGEDLHKDSLSLFYLKLITGETTHLGCAAAVYELTDAFFHVPPTNVFCYFSHYAKKDMEVYNTTKPIPGTMFTPCGCPPKYRETSDCLCIPAPVLTSQDQNTNHTKPSKPHTSSTQAYYNNFNNYQKYLDEMFSKFETSTIEPPLISSTEKEMLVSLFNKEPTTLWKPFAFITDKPQVSIIPRDWTSTSLQKSSILKPKVQKNLRLAPEQILQPIVQENEKWALQLKETLSTPIPKAGARTASNCNTGVSCPPPRIIMLPVVRLEDLYKVHCHKRDARHSRRSGNTSLVQSPVADDDFNFSKEDEIPQNISQLRSKLLQTMRKMRRNEQLDFFSNEQNLKPFHRLMDVTTESYQRNSESSERNLEPTDNNLDFIKHFLKPNLRVQTMIPRFHDKHYEQAKERAMLLLNQMEKRGRTVNFNRREIVQFDTKMRRFYKTMMSTRDEMQF